MNRRVEPKFFLAESLSPVSIYPESQKSEKSDALFFGSTTPSDPLAHSGSVEPQFFFGIVFSEVDLPGKRKKSLKKNYFFDYTPHMNTN
jgi:hypothetical protein